MAEDNYLDPSTNYPGVSSSEFLTYWAEKTNKPKCELCGNPNWTIKIFDDGRVPGLVIQRVSDFASEAVLPLIMASCSNCGNTKLFLEREINAKISGKVTTGSDVESE